MSLLYPHEKYTRLQPGRRCRMSAVCQSRLQLSIQLIQHTLRSLRGREVSGCLINHVPWGMIRKPAGPDAYANPWTVTSPVHKRSRSEGQTKVSLKLQMSNRAHHCAVVVRIQIETVRCCTLKHALDNYDSTLLNRDLQPPTDWLCKVAPCLFHAGENTVSIFSPRTAGGPIPDPVKPEPAKLPKKADICLLAALGSTLRQYITPARTALHLIVPR